MLNSIVKDVLEWVDAEQERTAPERAELAARKEKEKQARQQHIELCDLLTRMKNCEPGLADRESGEEISMANLYTIHSKRLINLAKFLNEKGLLSRLDRLPTDCKGAQFIRGLILAGVSASDPDEIACALEKSARLDSFAADVNYWLRSGLYDTILPDEWPVLQTKTGPDEQLPPEAGFLAASEELENCSKGASDGKASQKRAAGFAHWAFGMESGERWHLFRRVIENGRPQWRLQRKVQGLSRGKLQHIMQKLAEGEGFVSRAELATALCKVALTNRSKFKGQVAAPVARLRSVIRKNLKCDSDQDPVPWDETRQGWRAEVQVGYAVQEESQLNFRTRTEMQP